MPAPGIETPRRQVSQIIACLSTSIEPRAFSAATQQFRFKAQEWRGCVEEICRAARRTLPSAYGVIERDLDVIAGNCTNARVAPGGTAP